MSYKLDHKLKMPEIDLLFHVHEFDIDLRSNHIYLMGIDRGYEAVPGLDEPGIEYVISKRFIKNINLCMRINPNKPIIIHMKTCFSGHTKVETINGKKKISDIKIGDMVLTHNNQYKKVTDVTSNPYDGKMVRLGYGRNGNAQSIAATEDHPILVERNGVKSWIAIKDIEIGDVIFTLGKTCPKSGELIPYYKKEKKKERIFKRGGGCGEMHLINDILPFCKQKQDEGWVIVPVGAGVIPDAIGFKDGKIVAFEIENNVNAKDTPKLKFKQTKYNDALINNYIDGVEWVIKNGAQKKEKSPDSWYEADKSGFCKVKVLSKKTYIPNINKRKVYNITVEEDNSYVASNIVVHNCGGSWEEGMAIYDAIKSCPSKVTILNYTHARSMSSLIFSAADKRVMMPNSYFMFHDGTYGIEGTVKQVRSSLDFDKKNESIMIGIYAEKMNEKGEMAGKGVTKIRKWLREQMDKKEDVFLRADRTVELGLADEIFDYNWASLSKY